MALVASGVHCPSLSEVTNWKGEPNYGPGTSSWDCDGQFETPTIIIFESTEWTGESWLKKYPQTPAIYSSRWVVLFPDGRAGTKASEMFLDYLHTLR